MKLNSILPLLPPFSAQVYCIMWYLGDSTNAHGGESEKSLLQRLHRRSTPPILCAIILFGLGYLLGDDNMPPRLGLRTTTSHGDDSFGENDYFDDEEVMIDHEFNDYEFTNSSSDFHDNEFVNHFRQALLSDNLTSPIWRGRRLNDGLIPMIIQNGRLLCRRAHKQQIKDPQDTRRRTRSVVEMIHTGLIDGEKYENVSHILSNGLPFLLLNGDVNGCDNREQQDQFGYPRLTWCQPSPKYGVGWCNAIPVPTYSSWEFDEEYKSHPTWDMALSQLIKYPWSSKIKKAVWRGTTSYDGYFTGHELNETPRGKLVQLSIDYPEVIDAGFVDIIQQYAPRKEELSNQTILTNMIPFDDFMKYRAVIDIDGHTWSSRFPQLLCTNSVIIKIEPDYIEYFYHELKPMVHYVPASLKNLTQVAAYVLDDENEDEMREIVSSANSWCERKMNERQIVEDMMTQLEKYEMALDEYMQENTYDESMAPLVPDEVVNDLVDCY